MLQNLKTLVVIEGLLLIGLALYRFALASRHRGVVSPRAVGLTLLTPAVGLLSGNAFVFYAYLAGAVAFNARSRAELSANYLLMLPMTPLLALQTAAGDIYLFPLSAVVAMNLGAVMAVLVSSGRRSFARPELDAAALLLVALFVYVDARGVSATSVVRSVITFFVAFGGPYFLISRGLTRREDIDLALLRLGLAGVMVAIVAAFETIRHWVLYQTFNEALHVPIPLQSATLMMRGGRLRTGGPMVDYTAAGVLLATVLVLLPYLKPRFRTPWFWAVAVAVAAGLFATQSRGAWIAAAAGLVAVLVYRGRFWRAVMLAGAGLAAQAVVFLFLSDSSRLAETLGKSGASASTTDYRKNLLSQGLEQVAAHPLFGQPPKQLVANLPDLMQGQHIVDFVNSHLYVAMAAGIPWFLVWVAIWSLPAVRSWRARTAAAGEATPAEAPFAIVVTTMVAISATSIIDRNLTWPTIALALAGPCAALARSGGRASAQPRGRTLVAGMPREHEPAPLAPA